MKRLIACLVIFLLPVVVQAIGGGPLRINEKDSSGFLGEVDRTIRNDTLYLRYHLTTKNFDSDSVVISIYSSYENYPEARGHPWRDSSNSVLIYRRSDDMIQDYGFGTAYYRGDRAYYEGQLTIPTNGGSTKWWRYRLTAYQPHVEEETEKIHQGGTLHSLRHGTGMEIWYPSFGWFESTLPSPLDNRRLFLGWGIALELLWPKFETSLSTSYSGLWSTFNFSDPLKLECRFYSGTRSNFVPSLYASGKLSKLKLRYEDVEYRKVEWGGEAGIGVEGPFERLAYHYSTPFGGYHTIELYLVAESAGYCKIGTRYALMKADDVWAFRVSFHMEGLRLPDGSSWDLRRENNRPLPHQVLSLLGNPLGLLVLLYNQL